uniref:(northern house mosquito) hypothetical protein n=1 Tax=Culex pipiens TaxID=7175 RepID=A0A8D8G485_CULPI
MTLDKAKRSDYLVVFFQYNTRQIHRFPQESKNSILSDYYHKRACAKYEPQSIVSVQYLTSTSRVSKSLEILPVCLVICPDFADQDLISCFLHLLLICICHLNLHQLL